MTVSPMEQLKGLCFGLDVALYRDAPPSMKSDFDAFLDGAIDSNLTFYEQRDLTALEAVMRSILERPDAAEELDRLWKSISPTVAIVSGPDSSQQKPGIVYFFQECCVRSRRSWIVPEKKLSSRKHRSAICLRMNAPNLARLEGRHVKVDNFGKPP